ncbi:hypothetical protein EYC80_008937 [Monilinia laxa]|uniref:Uncharacterized protein n=1 Tax=Monilinia laxa TaxID=61186 RepID=A0A5N6K2D2_MONLA|nr:hypothetical protein EYC80_008937 [Monilinia laxa]
MHVRVSTNVFLLYGHSGELLLSEFLYRNWETSKFIPSYQLFKSSIPQNTTNIKTPQPDHKKISSHRKSRNIETSKHRNIETSKHLIRIQGLSFTSFTLSNALFTITSFVGLCNIIDLGIPQQT